MSEEQSGAELASDMRLLNANSLRTVADFTRRRQADEGNAALTRVLHREQLEMIALLLNNAAADTRGPEKRWDEALAAARAAPEDVVVAELAAALELDDEERVRGGKNAIGDED